MKKGETATTQIGKDGKNRLEIFRLNPGAEEKLFPPKHPYNKVKGSTAALEKLSKSDLIPAPEWTTLKKYENGGIIRKHILVNSEGSDYRRLRKAADSFAKNGSATLLTPKFDATLKNEDYAKFYADLKNTKYWGKCPDFRIDGKYYEYEGHQGKGDYFKMLSRGLKQADNVILQFTGQSDSYLRKLIKFRINEGQEINEVWIDKEGELTLFHKKPNA